jgi:hypothetical protein
MNDHAGITCRRFLFGELAPRNREEWARRGERGREHIVQRYSRSVITRKYHELLRRVAGEGGTGKS